jgi:signal transduction histidine kinase
MHHFSLCLMQIMIEIGDINLKEYSQEKSEAKVDLKLELHRNFPNVVLVLMSHLLLIILNCLASQKKEKVVIHIDIVLIVQ